jgi:hypothetical protein
LGEPGPDEEGLCVGGATGSGGQREQRHTDQEDPLPPDEVAESTGQQEGPGKGDQVGVDHPGECRLGEVQIVLDGGQRHVHDRLVKRVHQHREADDDQGDPTATLMDETADGRRHGSFLGLWGYRFP